MSADILLEARGLSCVYGRRLVVDGLSLQLRRGECLGLLGLNGAGKSTVLKLLSGVLAPHAGEVFIDGVNLGLRPLRAKRQLGYLPDVPPLYPDMTVQEFLLLCADLHAVPAPAQAVPEALHRCDLQEVGGRLIRHLSKGYQQRVGIAQAIVHQPAVLVLDEPTVGLDPRQLFEVRQLVRALARDRAVIFSSHQLREVEHTCTRVVMLHGGRIVHESSLLQSAIVFQLRLREAGPQVAQALAALPGVLKAEALDVGDWQVTVEDAAVSERIAACVAAAGWGLRELRRLETPLEQTFLALTAGDEAA
jgi:ABC-2 type transport system ATP-binding protein